MKAAKLLPQGQYLYKVVFSVVIEPDDQDIRYTKGYMYALQERKKSAREIIQDPDYLLPRYKHVNRGRYRINVWVLIDKPSKEMAVTAAVFAIANDKRDKVWKELLMT